MRESFMANATDVLDASAIQSSDFLPRRILGMHGMMGCAMWRTVLLQTAILLSLTVGGCGEDSNSTESSATDLPTQSAGATKPGTITVKLNRELEPFAPPEKPKIDVIVERIDVPTHVKREQYFELTIGLKNNSVGTQVAGTANVEIRATLDHPTGLTNVAIDSMQVRELRPGVIKVQTGQGRAPFKAGVWTVRAVVTPVDYIDDANNYRDVFLVVD
jgi:hypothetical protein